MVGINEYAIDSNTCDASSYLGTSYTAWDISDLLNGDSSAWRVYSDPDPASWDWRPAMSLSSTSDVHSIVTDNATGSFTYVDSSGSVVDFATHGPDPFTSQDRDLSGQFAPEGTVIAPEEPNGTLDVDGRVTSAVWRDNRLVFVSTYPCGQSGIFDCVRVSELDTSTATANQNFLIGDFAAGYDNFMGGVSVDGNGTLYVVWSRSRYDTPVGIWASHQLSTDAVDTMNARLQIRSGVTGYDGRRWGDFAILATDPSDPGAIWQAHEFTRTGGGWGTYVSRLTPPVTDTTPPSIGSPTGFIVAPQTLGKTAHVHMSWGASDPSGISKYEFQKKKGARAWTAVTLGSPTATSVDVALTVGSTYRFRVRATDGAHNTSAWDVTGAAQLRLVQENAAAIAYSGSWKRRALTGASGGYVKYATSSSDRAKLTFTGAAASFVTTLSPARGICEIWVDGSLAATFDTYAAGTTKKRIGYASPRLTFGTHTIEIRVKGAKRSASTSTRVDLDAFLTWP